MAALSPGANCASSTADLCEISAGSRRMTPLATMPEVAAQLRVSRRWLQDFLKEHPYYRMAGNKKVFTTADIQQLVDSLPCPSNSSRRVSVKARTGAYVARISASMSTELRELLERSLQEK